MNYNSQSYPIILSPGKVLHTAIDNEPVVLVGTYPNGFTAILSPDGWQLLRKWKAAKLYVGKQGRVRVHYGRRLGPFAANFITGNDLTPNRVVVPRNGNLFDLRPSNLCAVPRSLIEGARKSKRETPHKASEPVKLRDGRVRSPRKPNVPAHERLKALLHN